MNNRATMTRITTSMMMTSTKDSADDRVSARRLVEAQHAQIELQSPGATSLITANDDFTNNNNGEFTSVNEYFQSRQTIINAEKALNFDHRCRQRSSPLETQVEAIIQNLKERDRKAIYAPAPHQKGFRGQNHARFPGDHFLTNMDLIPQTALFRVSRAMPKGAHLHIHFNACLEPEVLLEIAKGMERMFVTSDVALVDEESFDRCEIQFGLRAVGMEGDVGDLFEVGYRGRGQAMRFEDFRDRFPGKGARGMGVDEWLREKLVFSDEESHNHLQTAAGAWQKFNGRTRMMKGLFNYETAYRKYTQLFLEDLVRDNILYAEIRPNFMSSNQLFHDDGTDPIDNWGIMEIIIDEVQRFKQTQAEKKGGKKFFTGVKVIYCTPRSFSSKAVKEALDQCILFKKKWPQWIAGFDLVGEEAQGKPLRAFIPEFLDFQRQCRESSLDIPFLFHCGETLDVGTDTDGNLVDALLLGSRRIGHGFALARHPYVMQRMKERGVCLELCPISNEVLGLTGRVGGHAMYELLGNGVHCTVSSDNGTLFRSSLAHDFYQVMVGREDMGLAGWKQLILWSIEHSCMSDEERRDAMDEWEREWQRFLGWVVEEYGGP